ncbi:hypothetical protein QBC42DRAFT_332263, partial [Cladorrhinum samala]
NASFLAGPKYGCDFVVATTQASINSGLLEFLANSNQPETYLCFLADDDGNISQQITLDQLLKLTGGVNPFDIPDGTPYSDSRIATLSENSFIGGVKIQLGLPPGIAPTDLPPVVTLGANPGNVAFNMFCSQFQIIQNSPPSGFGKKPSPGHWKVWSQPPGTPWYVETKVDLVVQDLDQELQTPYFLANPALTTQLKKQLLNLSNTAFSLQQLAFDLDNALLQTLPTFGNISQGSNAMDMLQKSFIALYSTSAKNQGLPLVAVTAVSESVTDASQLQLAAYTRGVSPLQDASGVQIANPTPLQASVTTLDYICSVTDTLSPIQSFGWNWVLPQDVDNMSGVIAINRNVIAGLILDQLLQVVSNSCFTATTDVMAHAFGDVSYEYSFTPGAKPQTALVNPVNPNVFPVDVTQPVISIAYSSYSTDDDKSGVTYGELSLTPNYTCDVYFSGTTMQVKQRLWVKMFAEWDDTGDTINPYDKTITDTYNISVDQNGVLQTQQGGSTAEDNSQSADRSGIVNAFTNINNLVNGIKGDITDLVSTHLQPIPFNNLKNFVFPGARVFTYKSAGFSEGQDLICDITYLDSSETHPLVNFLAAAVPSAVAVATVGSLTLTHESDLMQNYLQGQVVSPQGKFEALQTHDGHALLFTLDSSSVFHVIQERSGSTQTGWEIFDLSTAAIQAQFGGGGQSKDAIVCTFDAGQSALDQTISLAMAVSVGGSNHLLASLGNSSSDTSWATKPAWTPYPFDAVDQTPPSSIRIAGILFAETTTTGGQQYLIVDIDRSAQGQTTKDIERYYVDPSKSTGSYWVKHDIPVDIEDVAASYQSCVGRLAHSTADGVYTSGTVAGAAQLIYVPIINEFGTGPPLPIRLNLPGGASPSAITTARSVDSTSSSFQAATDLYAISGSTLYRFAADTQASGKPGMPLVTSGFLSGTDKLMAMTQNGVTVLWGKNSDDQVYYLSCPDAQVSLPGSWSTPVPILSGIERVSAYSNVADGGNTIFASGGGKLQKLMQATGAPSSNVWRAQEITLAVPPSEKALSFKSYTTAIQVVADDDQNSPLPASGGGVELLLSTMTRAPVYINGLYYVLGQTPISIKTDSTDSVTVIEATDDITGTAINVSADGGQTWTSISPMDNSFQKLAALGSSAGELRSATIRTGSVVAGGFSGAPSTTTPLIDPATSDADVTALSTSLASLKSVYTKVQTSTAPIPQQATPPSSSPPSSVVPATLFLASSPISSLGSGLAIAAGDLYRWLKSGVEAAVSVVKDTISDMWHFIAIIGGQIYRAALDTVDAVIGAVEWVFNAVKTAIEDVVRFVEFLFEWDDIRRTKDVMHNVVKLYLQNQVDSLPAAKLAFNNQIAAAEQAINTWAGISDWPSLIGDPASKPCAGTASNPTKGQTPGSRLLTSHFQNNASNLTITGDQPTINGAAAHDPVDILVRAVASEAKASTAVQQLMEELATKMDSMSVGDALNAVAAILADGVLSSAQVVVDALLDVLVQLASSTISLMDTKIHIPVISDILNALDVTDISFLDLFIWIAAVAYTVVYKTANQGKAPFPAGDNNITAIISATSWDVLAAIFSSTPLPTTLSPPNDEATGPSFMVLDAALSSSATTSTTPLQSTIFIAGHSIAGITSLLSALISSLEAECPTATNPYSKPSAILGGIGAACSGAADFLAPYLTTPIQNSDMADLGKATTVAVLLSKLAFSTSCLGDADESRAAGAMVDAILTIPGLVVSGWHFYELGHDESSLSRSAAIVGEVSNLAGCVGRVAYAVAVANNEDVEGKEVAVGVLAVADVVVAGLQTAEAII